MMQLFKNFASTLVAANVLATDTLISLMAGTGARFPAIAAASGDYFYLVMYQKTPSIGGSPSYEINHEVVQVTNLVGDLLTVVRAQDGTIAQVFNAGDPIELRYIAASALAERAAQNAALAAVQAAIAAAVVPHGSQEFIANGSFTVPAGVTKIVVSWMSGGAGGAGGVGDIPGVLVAAPGGVGAAGSVSTLGTLLGASSGIKPFTVVPGTVYPVTVGVGGAGGAGSSGSGIGGAGAAGGAGGARGGFPGAAGLTSGGGAGAAGGAGGAGAGADGLRGKDGTVATSRGGGGGGGGGGGYLLIQW